MKIHEVELPDELRASFEVLVPEITEYLELEEAGFELSSVRYNCYLVAEESVGFVVFDYESNDQQHFAFYQHSIVSGIDDPGTIGCWPRTKGETLAWSIAEYLSMNPV